jgi:SPP1 family predicted phage head-tail adaptor
MALRAGDLNRRVRIDRRVETPDGQGGTEASWQPLATRWAKATPVAGREALVNGTLRASQPWKILLRRTDVTVEDRIVMLGPNGNDVVLGIQSVADPDGRREALELFCASEPA